MTAGTGTLPRGTRRREYVTNSSAVSFCIVAPTARNCWAALRTCSSRSRLDTFHLEAEHTSMLHLHARVHLAMVVCILVGAVFRQAAAQLPRRNLPALLAMHASRLSSVARHHPRLRQVRHAAEVLPDKGPQKGHAGAVPGGAVPVHGECDSCTAGVILVTTHVSYNGRHRPPWHSSCGCWHKCISVAASMKLLHPVAEGILRLD